LLFLKLHVLHVMYIIQGDQKVSVHLTITVQSSGAQKLLITLYNTMFVRFDVSNHQYSCKYSVFIFLWSPWWWLPPLAETCSSFYLQNKIVSRRSTFSYLCILFDVEYKLRIYPLREFSSLLLLLRPSCTPMILLNTVSSDTTRLCSSLNLRHQVAHPYNNMRQKLQECSMFSKMNTPEHKLSCSFVFWIQANSSR